MTTPSLITVKRRSAKGPQGIAEVPEVARKTTGDAPLPRAAILRRTKRKAGRIGRYLRMASAYHRARRESRLPTPVLIVCQNRTGSTFLNRLFGEHPDCWTYREGSHQEAMRHRDCPRWLSGQPFLERWQIRDCSAIERFLTPLWMAHLAQGHRFGVFKIPHALSKATALQKIVPDVRIVLLVRHPAAQVASAVAKNNSCRQLQATSDALLHFLTYQRDQIQRLSLVRYEDLVSSPVESLSLLCESLGMQADSDVIERCVNRIGVQPGRKPLPRAVPPEMLDRVKQLCQLLDYDLEDSV